MRRREVSPRQLVEVCLDRIDRLNPDLNAIRPRPPERVRAEADEADRRVAGGEAGPLLGVPVAVKDDTDVVGEVTTWGSAAFTTPAGADAQLVRRLREAGAVV